MFVTQKLYEITLNNRQWRKRLMNLDRKDGQDRIVPNILLFISVIFIHSKTKLTGTNYKFFCRKLSKDNATFELIVE